MSTKCLTGSIIGLKELRENTENYISKVKKGMSFVVVRRSRPIFKISPASNDLFGDEGTWENAADFTKVNKKGVSFEKVLARLRLCKNG